MSQRRPAPSTHSREGRLVAALAALEGLLVQKHKGEQPLPVFWCGVGQWYANHGAPDGQPCAKRCYEIRVLVGDVVPEQPELWSVAS
jgi:hypothetical protein